MATKRYPGTNVEIVAKSANDSRRDPSDPPQPCPLAPVPPPVPSVHVPAALVAQAKADPDAEIRALTAARKKRVRGFVAIALTALAAPLGYIAKGIADSWTESRKLEDAAAKARHDKFVELAAKLDVRPVTEEGVVAELVARVAKCEVAAATADRAAADVEKLEANFLGYIVGTGARVRRTPDMPAPADVEIVPAPREPRRSVFAPRPEVRFR